MRVAITICCALLGGVAAAQEPDAGVDDPPVEEEPLYFPEEGEEPPLEAPPLDEPPGEAPPVTAPPAPPVAGGAPTLDTVSIIGTPEEIARVSGSAHEIAQEELETFEYDDVHRLLDKVPGVYVRGEDGYGLRPNIGLRGAASDRSAKVTLMEDGVLLGPAPYAAPPAYYFPLPTRMVAVEVFKGPAAIKHGPNTIGGAINMVTRPVPASGGAGEIDIAAGQEDYRKAHAWWGHGWKYFGVLLEGAHLSSDGFKELDGGGDTGFAKNEVMVKLRANNALTADVHHRLELKLGYADEVSDETYVGLTDEDFAANPYRRYAGSARDRMDWWRTQVQLRYSVAFGEDVDLKLVGYRHDFARTWGKMDGFADGRNLHDVYAAPDALANRVRLAVLRGDEDSAGADTTLRMGINDREFVAQGVQLTGYWRHDTEWFGSHLEVGARLHHDRIERAHDAEDFLMLTGTLVPVEDSRTATVRNTGEAVAVALHAVDELRIGQRLFITPGLRVEIIDASYEDARCDPDAGCVARAEDTSTVLIPGGGVFFQATEWLGVLAGVHKGFSPVVPGPQLGRAEPEESINYEAGLRVDAQRQSGTRAELIGFFNDYDNLTAQCTLSGGGCDPDELATQFDAGRVFVYGLEALAEQTIPLPWHLRLDLGVTYTLTLSEFQHDFVSSFALFGEVEKGDSLPYVPEHQASARVGLSSLDWRVELATIYVGEMRDVAGSGEIPELERIEHHVVLDLAAYYEFTKNSRLYGKIDNLLDSEYAISRRPFGLRPGRPFQASIGYKHRFGD